MKKTILLLVPIVLCVLSQTGCQTAGHYDPVKTAQIQAALEPIASGALRRAILNSPHHAAETANYARAIGGVFCDMSATSQFDPLYLITALDRATAGLQADVDPLIIDTKNALIAIYEIAWADRLRAELPPDSWLKFTADFVCDVIDRTLKDLGEPGVK